MTLMVSSPSEGTLLRGQINHKERRRSCLTPTELPASLKTVITYSTGRLRPIASCVINETEQCTRFSQVVSDGARVLNEGVRSSAVPCLSRRQGTGVTHAAQH